MRVSKPVIVRSSHEQESLRSRFSNGLTSALRRVSPARWGFSGAPTEEARAPFVGHFTVLGPLEH